MESPRLSIRMEGLLSYIRRRAFWIEAGSFVFALLLGRVELFRMLLPLGVAFTAAMDMAGQNVYYPLAGALVGSLLAGEAGYPALAALGLYMASTLAYRFFSKRLRRVDKLMFLGAAQLAVIPLFFIATLTDALRGLALLALTLMMAVAFQNGIRALKSISVRNRLREEEQISLCLLLGALALATADASVYAFSLGVVVAAWTAMFAAYSKGLPAVAASVVIGGMLVLGGKAQPQFLADLAVCTLAAVFCRSMGPWGITGGFLISCMVTEGYAGAAGLTVGVVNAAPAAAALVLIPKGSMLSLRAVVDAAAREERTARAALRSLQERTAQGVTLTAKAVEQIAGLFPENTDPPYDEGEERRRMARSAANVCADCTHRVACWRDKEAATDAVAAMLPASEKGLRPRAVKPLQADCPRTVPLASAAGQAREAYRIQCGEALQARSRQAFARRQLNSVAGVIGRLAAEVAGNEWPVEGEAQQIMRRLGREGFALRGALVQKRNGCLTAELRLREHWAKRPLQWEDAVSRALETPMRLLAEYKTPQGAVLEFEQARRVKARMGTAALAMRNSPASGDSTAQANLPGGKALFALSDGMGTGNAARAESAAALDMLCQLYRTGFPRDDALECVNRLLMQRADTEMYATVDALFLDLETCAAEFIKFGAQPSFVLREGRVHTIYAEALPVGILDEASPAVHAASLRRNDAVVMLTDGALEALGEDTEAEIIACVGAANTCEDAARALLEAANQRGGNDDMTVMVIRLE